jgi:LysR family transcriptional regulator, glycine cleavage system transcriptional activator
MRKAPSTTGLRVLDAVVRHGTLSDAARELCVTPAAISHRLRELEARCGHPLVSRVTGRFHATETGRAVIEALGDAFERIRAADALLQADRRQELRITASYSFAALWLSPRISAFQQRRPEAVLFLHPTHSPLTDRQADVAIVHAATRPEQGDWSLLFEDRCAAMARADHPFFERPDSGPEHVMRNRLVHIAHERGPDWGEFSWQQWMRIKGLPAAPRPKGATVSAEHLAVELLISGDAFALISMVNARRLLAEGRLRAVEGSEVPSGCAYWVSANSGRGPRAQLARAFVDWITGELRQAA